MKPYRGRFAPSPTGPLHFGSLVAAVASYLDARAHCGEWLVRIEDVDIGRAVPGVADEILRTLERFGFTWDCEVLWQSCRTERYRAALMRLWEQEVVFSCACSRRDLAGSGRLTEDGVAWYPGTCREGLPSDYLDAGRIARSVRFRVNDHPIAFVDRCQGHVEDRLESSVGDFVILRADGLFAYQLAVVVDDAEQGITDVVRGADLLSNTPRQIALQRALGYSTPRYLHVPVAAHASGEKLSKQTGAQPVDPGRAVQEVHAALRFLNQNPPAQLIEDSLAALWEWAVAKWDAAAVPNAQSLPLPDVTNRNGDSR
ncbi:MAG: tRNA glutamyl-Q(34) synthetase GluQRS [Bryobacterales bacterium]|nr:tRNA glutamyl-Q(34) synthetase GluQRS [Bryobacterales bacterium]